MLYENPALPLKKQIYRFLMQTSFIQQISVPTHLHNVMAHAATTSASIRTLPQEGKTWMDQSDILQKIPPFLSLQVCWYWKLHSQQAYWC